MCIRRAETTLVLSSCEHRTRDSRFLFQPNLDGAKIFPRLICNWGTKGSAKWWQWMKVVYRKNIVCLKQQLFHRSENIFPKLLH